MNKYLGIVILISFIATSCATSVPVINYTYPHDGKANNANIVVKDYEPLGIIFVKSTEVVDGGGNHTGSKITYEMLMKEAQKLDAHDVINIRIDVNQIEEIVKDKNGYDVTRTTYNYTASALAIKYTTAIQAEAKSSQDIGSTMLITKPEAKSSSSKTGKVVGIVLGSLLLAGGIVALGVSLNSSSSSY